MSYFHFERPVSISSAYTCIALFSIYAVSFTISGGFSMMYIELKIHFTCN